MRRLTLVTALVALLLGVSPAAPAADSAPTLVGITYLNGPFARVGWSSIPVARVQLDQPSQGDTAVLVSSSNPGVAQLPSQVVVPNGMSTVDVPVTGVSEGTATLSAQLGVTSLNLTPPLEVAGPGRVPALDSLTVSPSTVAPGPARPPRGAA